MNIGKPHVLIALGAVLFSTLLTGCSLFKVEAIVSSDTSWSGAFDNRTVDGNGSMKVDMGSRSGTKCAVVQKQTERGYLTVEITGGDSATTTAAFGLVSVCTD